MEDSLEARRAERKREEQERKRKLMGFLKLACGILLVSILLIWILSSGINRCNRKTGPPSNTVRENDAFANPSGFGHLFISIEHSATKDAPGDDQGLHVQIGYLDPKATAQSIWIGSRSKQIDKHDYPTRNADILIFKITNEEEGKQIAKTIKAAAGKYSNPELWTWMLTKGDGEKSGNCVQFAAKLLEEMKVIVPDTEPEWKKALITGTQLKEILLNQSFFEPGQTIMDEVNTTSDPQKKLRLREKLATWEQVRDLWDDNHKRKK